MILILTMMAVFAAAQHDDMKLKYMEVDDKRSLDFIKGFYETAMSLHPERESYMEEEVYQNFNQYYKSFNGMRDYLQVPIDQIMHVYDGEREQLAGTGFGVHRVIVPIAYLLDQVPTEILVEYQDFPWDVAAFIKVQAQSLKKLDSHAGSGEVLAEFEKMTNAFYDDDDWYEVGASVAKIARMIRLRNHIELEPVFKSSDAVETETDTEDESDPPFF